MKAGYSIAWSEGTYLTQQHFQYWDTSIQDTHARMMQILMPYAYGLISVVWDTDALNQGIARIKNLRWMSQKGEILTHDDSNMPVLECVIDPQSSRYIYLQSSRQGCQGLSGYPSCSASPQYCVEYQMISDEYDSSKKQEVALKRAHLMLSTSCLAPGGGWSYPIAQLKHRIGNHYEFDRAFIPAVIKLGASENLNHTIQRIMYSVAEKSCSLQAQLKRKWEAELYFDAVQWSDFLVELTQLHQHGVAHPHALYLLASKRIHQAYLLSDEHVQIPPYQHDNLTQLFSWIETTLQSKLAINLQSEEDKIVLTRIDELHYSTGNIPIEVIESCDWYLGVCHESEDLQWIRQFVQQVKLSPAENLSGILISALPGIGLQHVQRPPSSIRLRSGFEYFRLKKQDPYWESLKTYHNLTIYLPKPFHAVNVSLDIVKE